MNVIIDHSIESEFDDELLHKYNFRITKFSHLANASRNKMQYTKCNLQIQL